VLDMHQRAFTTERHASTTTAEERFRALDEFFLGTGTLHETLARLEDRLERTGIDYAILGGLALGAHGYVRVTQDIDVLMTREGLDAFDARLVGRTMCRPSTAPICPFATPRRPSGSRS
jgi:hypothetical protein